MTEHTWELVGGGAVAAIYFLIREGVLPWTRRSNGKNGHSADHNTQIKLAERSLLVLEEIRDTNKQIAVGVFKVRGDLTLAMERQGEARKVLDRIDRKGHRADD